MENVLHTVALLLDPLSQCSSIRCTRSASLCRYIYLETNRDSSVEIPPAVSTKPPGHCCNLTELSSRAEHSSRVSDEQILHGHCVESCKAKLLASLPFTTSTTMTWACILRNLTCMQKLTYAMLLHAIDK